MAQNTAQNMADNSVVTAITALVSPILRDLSLELYDCEYAGGVLKVTIDTPPGSEAGVDLEQLALVTRLLGRELDHDDNDVIIPGKYTLEVTSLVSSALFVPQPIFSARRARSYLCVSPSQ